MHSYKTQPSADLAQTRPAGKRKPQLNIKVDTSMAIVRAKPQRAEKPKSEESGKLSDRQQPTIVMMDNADSSDSKGHQGGGSLVERVGAGF